MGLHFPVESIDQSSPVPDLLRARTTTRATVVGDVWSGTGAGDTAFAETTLVGATLVGDRGDAVGSEVAPPVQAPAASETLATTAARPILAAMLLMILPFPK